MSTSSSIQYISFFDLIYYFELEKKKIMSLVVVFDHGYFHGWIMDINQYLLNSSLYRPEIQYILR